MTVLSRPRHPIVADALALTGEWSRGQIIDGAPALGHAVKVALVLGRYLPDAAPELVAAVLLHDSPQYAPKDTDLDAVLTVRLGPAVTRIVRDLEREHIAPDQRLVPDVATVDRWTLYASTADKIVSVRSILGRAARAADPAAYWRARRAFASRVPYFAAFHTAAAPYLPPGMAGELARLVVRAEHATGPYCDPPGHPTHEAADADLTGAGGHPEAVVNAGGGLTPTGATGAPVGSAGHRSTR